LDQILLQTNKKILSRTLTQVDGVDDDDDDDDEEVDDDNINSDLDDDDSDEEDHDVDHIILCQYEKVHIDLNFLTFFFYSFKLVFVLLTSRYLFNLNWPFFWSLSDFHRLKELRINGCVF